MKFTALTDRVISHANQVNLNTAFTTTDLAAALDLPPRDFSPTNIQLHIGELAQELLSTSSRPHAEQVLGETAALFAINPRAALIESLNTALFGKFIDNVRAVVPLIGFDPIGSPPTIHVHTKTSEEDRLKLLEIARTCDLEISQAVIESLLLTFLTGNEVHPLVDDITALSKAHQRPAISFGHLRIPGLDIGNIPAAHAAATYSSQLQELASRAGPRLHNITDPALKAVVVEVLSHPGLLFFEHLVQRSEGLRCAIHPYAEIRSFLHKHLQQDQELQDIISNLISLTSNVMDRLITSDPAQYGKSLSIRPDSYLTPVTEAVCNTINLTTGTQLNAKETASLRSILREKINNDPSYGSSLSGAFSIDYPANSHVSTGRLTVKVFRDFHRRTFTGFKMNQCVLPVFAADSTGSSQEDYKKAKAISTGLEHLLDDLELFDRHTPAAEATRIGEQAINLLTQGFYSFEELTAFGLRKATPNFQMVEHIRPVVQVMRLWCGLCLLETRIHQEDSEDLLERIDDWFIDYNIQRGMPGHFTLSELAGIAPLIPHLISRAKEIESESSPSLEFVERVLRTYRNGIELLPSGLHAFFWLFPDHTRDTVVELLKNKLITVDAPSAAASNLLRILRPNEAVRVLSDLRQACNHSGPIPLSKIQSAKK